ncbi:MAG: ribosomal L7Ae/L30e/S12e/Gadd45 family protein [Nanoarchaeota archaeon]|mgnify:CR=1 FL=1
MDELKKAVKQKGIVIGTERTLKRLRAGKVSTVFVSKNCPNEARQTIERYAKLSKTRIVNLDINNDELGISAKKPYSIAVLSI